VNNKQNINQSSFQNEISILYDPLSDVENGIRNLIKEKINIEYEFYKFKEQYEIETRKFLLELIEVVDAFERLFNIIKTKEETLDQQTKIWIGNFRTIYRLLLRTLKEFEILPIETFIGEIVNPHIHNVVEVVEKPEQESGTIIEIIKKGYIWKKNLLRPVDVKVVKNE